MPFCPFCYDNIKDRIVAEQNSAVAIQDNYPVTAGHLLIVPKRHMEDYFSMNETEKKDTGDLIMKLKDRITAKAVNINQNYPGHILTLSDRNIIKQ